MLAPSQTVQDLQRARNLIADPAVWVAGSPACDDFHCAITADLFVRGIADPNDDGSGWINVSPYLIMAAGELLPEAERCGAPHHWVWRVNDSLGHAAALRMYDRAIQLAMAGQHA